MVSGAPGDDGAWEFERVDSIWSQVRSMLQGSNDTSYQGTSIAMDGVGSTIAFGAPFDPATPTTGSIWVFTCGPTASPVSSTMQIFNDTKQPTTNGGGPHNTTDSPTTVSPTTVTNPSPTSTTTTTTTTTPTLPTPTPTNIPTTTSSPTPILRLGNKANVLLLIIDDLKPLIKSYGGVTPVSPDTPNFDRISQRGVRFLNAHAQMSMCGPSRASFLTSMRPDTLNLYSLNQNVLAERVANFAQYQNKILMTLPRLFKDSGYQTYGIGKVFHESEWELMASSDLWTVPVYSWINYVRAPSFTKPYQGFWINNPDVADTQFPDGQAASMAAQLINSLTTSTPSSKPWFLAVGLWKPHLPWAAPAKYFDEMPPVNTYPGSHHGSIPSGISQQDYQMIKGDGCGEVSPYGIANLAGWDLTLSQEQAANWAYTATVRYSDQQIGLILDALDASSASLTTHIVLLGDHGFHLGDHGLWCKHTCFEQATRSPLVVAPALIETYRPRNQASAMPVELLDLMPTLADLCALPKSNPSWATWEGVSLMPIVNDPTQYVKSASVSQYFRGAGASKMWGYSLRTVRYRFTVWCPAVMQFALRVNDDQDCPVELYDYFTDRYEQTSLGSANPTLRQQFAGLLNSWIGVQRFDRLRGQVPFDALQINGAKSYFSADTLYP